MIEYLAPLMCDPDLLLERIARSASETEKVIRAGTDSISVLRRIIETNDVVFVLWNDRVHQEPTGYSVLKGGDALAKVMSGDKSLCIAFNRHPLTRLPGTLSAVGTYGTPERAAILAAAGTASEVDIIDYFART